MPTSGTVASKGTVSQAGNVLTWSIAELRTETATLKYTATHDPTKSGGVEQVNTSVTYSDAEGHTVTFPNPSVNVHGCAAAIELTPPTATNELTTGASHTVAATVTDDLGDPVSGVGVSFEVTAGPNAGATGGGTTGAGGTVPFTYPSSGDRSGWAWHRHDPGMLHQRSGHSRVRHRPEDVGRHDTAGRRV